eukprot:3282654-Pyramimonas_sp.AAC.1
MEGSATAELAVAVYPRRPLTASQLALRDAQVPEGYSPCYSEWEYRERLHEARLESARIPIE